MIGVRLLEVIGLLLYAKPQHLTRDGQVFSSVALVSFLNCDQGKVPRGHSILCTFQVPGLGETEVGRMGGGPATLGKWRVPQKCNYSGNGYCKGKT